MTERAILSLPIAEIEVGERIGFFNIDHAARLSISMAAEGQHSPIHVKRNGNAAKRKWKLVAGLHRLRGAEAIPWTHIDAVQVADASASASELRRLELSENVDHRHRRPIERAILMVAHGRLEEEIDHPGHVGETKQARGARKRWGSGDARPIIGQASVGSDRDASANMAEAEIGTPKHAYATMAQASEGAAIDTRSNLGRVSVGTDHDTCATIAHVCDWRDRTAAAFGVSLRALERHQHLYRNIVEPAELADLAQAVNDHPLGERLSSMTTLASIRMPDTRRKVAELILTRADWKSMDEVMASAGWRSTGRRVDHDAKMMDFWLGLEPKKRQAHLDWLADDLLPGEAVAMLKRLKKRGVLP